MGGPPGVTVRSTTSADSGERTRLTDSGGIDGRSVVGGQAGAYSQARAYGPVPLGGGRGDAEAGGGLVSSVSPAKYRSLTSSALAGSSRGEARRGPRRGRAGRRPRSVRGRRDVVQIDAAAGRRRA